MIAVASMPSSNHPKHDAREALSTIPVVAQSITNVTRIEQGESSDGEHKSKAISRGGVIAPFPWKVHEMLENASARGIDHIVCWLSHGQAFMVHKVDEFVDQVMPKWFSQSKFASFQRQLNLYGFRRLTTGKDKGAYFHRHFMRGHRPRVGELKRQKIKGSKVQRTSDPEFEHKFWNSPDTLSGRNSSSCEISNSTIRIDLPQTDNVASPHTSRRGPPTPTLSDEESSSEGEIDILYFEGKPFHYLDRELIVDNFVSME